MIQLFKLKNKWKKLQYSFLYGRLPTDVIRLEALPKLTGIYKPIKSLIQFITNTFTKFLNDLLFFLNSLAIETKE